MVDALIHKCAVPVWTKVQTTHFGWTIYNQFFCIFSFAGEYEKEKKQQQQRHNPSRITVKSFISALWKLDLAQKKNNRKERNKWSMRERYGAKRNPKKKTREKKINNLNVTHIYLFIQKKTYVFWRNSPKLLKAWSQRKESPSKKNLKKFANERKKEKKQTAP